MTPMPAKNQLRLPARVLCVDDDPQMCRALEVVVRLGGHTPRAASSVAEALDIARHEVIDLVVTDQQMPSLRGIDLVAMLRAEGLDTPVIILTAYGAIEDAVDSLQRGAHHYLVKPVDPEVLSAAITRSLDTARQTDAPATRRRGAALAQPGRQLVGESFAFRQLVRAMEEAVTSRGSMLIEGEPGTGKDAVAQAIRDLGDRADAPFIMLNCAALPEELLEGALLGNESGVFGGPAKRSIGALERANGGILLLGEISEMRLELQGKLLRALQEHEFTRVGGTEAQPVDVRIMATTNRPLAASVRTGTFRKDLFYRLNVVHLRVPPLRERREDIPLLARQFAARALGTEECAPDAITLSAMRLLELHDWPGNVRELQQAVERAVATSGGGPLEAWHFALVHGGGEPDGADASMTPSGREVLMLDDLDVMQAEERLIHLALERCANNRTAAATLLGMHVRTLRRKLKAIAQRGLTPTAVGSENADHDDDTDDDTDDVTGVVTDDSGEPGASGFTR